MKKRTKFMTLYSTILAVFVILSGRLWYLQVVQASHYRALGNTSKLRLVTVAAPRGIITDRSGRPLVYNVPAWAVEIVPHGVPRLQASSIYSTLSHVLGGNPSAREIALLVRAGAWQPYQPVILPGHVSTAAALIIKQIHQQLPGVRSEPTSIRQYVSGDPNWSLSHILGYASKISPVAYTLDRRMYPRERVALGDQAGATGIEYSMDSYLHGINGLDYVEVDAGERPIRTLRHVPPVPGDKVYLTIDWKLQKQVSRDLAAGLQHIGITQGAVVMEDPNTGRILAMASYPSYNNNLFARGISQTQYDALVKNPDSPLLDLATQGQLPPGSTFKIVTAAAALETGVADSSRIINDGGVLKPCPTCQLFYGWEPPPGLGPMNIVSALSESSDIYFYTVAGGNPSIDPHMPRIGPDRLSHYASLFGLGQKTGIELPNESPGQIPGAYWFNHLDLHYPQNRLIRNPGEVWTIGRTYNMAIGQGFDTATPLQMAGVISTIANGGTLYQPRIVDHIEGRVIPRQGATAHWHVIQPFVPSPVRSQVVSPNTIALIQQGLHGSVTLPLAQHGTSFNVTDPRIDAAGKTGTAEDHLPNGTQAADALWVGYAPFNHPRVAISVIAEHAGSEGAYVAAPIAHKCLEDFFHLKPLKPNWLQDVIRFLVPGGGAQ